MPDGFVDAVARFAQGEPARWGTTFAVDGTDAAVARAVQLGATVVGAAPADAGPTRVAVLEDAPGRPLRGQHVRPELTGSPRLR